MQLLWRQQTINFINELNSNQQKLNKQNFNQFREANKNKEKEKYLNFLYLNDVKNDIEIKRTSKQFEKQKEKVEDSDRIKNNLEYYDKIKSIEDQKKRLQVKNNADYYKDYFDKNQINNRFKEPKIDGGILINKPDNSYLYYKEKFLIKEDKQIKAAPIIQNQQLENVNSNFSKNFFTKLGKPFLYDQEKESKDFIYFKNKDLGYNGEIHYRFDLSESTNNVLKPNSPFPINSTDYINYGNEVIIDRLREKFSQSSNLGQTQNQSLNQKIGSQKRSQDYNIILATEIPKNYPLPEIHNRDISFGNAQKSNLMYSKYKKLQDQKLMKQLLDKQTGKIFDKSKEKYVPYNQGNFFN